MIDVAKTQIGPDETYGELQNRLSFIARDLASDWIRRLVVGNYMRIPQNTDLATYANKIERSETELNVNRDGKEEYNRFRAFTPSPSVFIQTSHGRLKITEAKLSNQAGTPGQIVSLQPLTLSFLGSSLELQSVAVEGKGLMSGSDWANGQRLSVDDSLV